MYRTVCVCVCVLLSVWSLCFLQSHSHSITQHCAEGYSSTKAFSFTITSSSLFSLLSVSSLSLSSTCLSLCLSRFLCFSPSPSEISAISADCHIVCEHASLCMRSRARSKVAFVPSHVLISSCTELHVYLGVGHSRCVKRVLTEGLVASWKCFYRAGIGITSGYLFRPLFFQNKSVYLLQRQTYAPLL